MNCGQVVGIEIVLDDELLAVLVLLLLASLAFLIVLFELVLLTAVLPLERALFCLTVVLFALLEALL